MSAFALSTKLQANTERYIDTHRSITSVYRSRLIQCVRTLLMKALCLQNNQKPYNTLLYNAQNDFSQLRTVNLNREEQMESEHKH